MRASVLIAAPLVAAAYAQSSSDNATVVPISSGSTTVSTTVSYSNPATSYLTQTNSLGVVTGQPEVATAQSALPPGVTTQPSVATIPAGLPTGVTYIVQNISRSLTSFEVSVGSSTTVVVGGVPSGASVVTGGSMTGSNGASATGGAGSGSDSSASGSDSSASQTSDSGSGSSASSSASPSSSSSAASANIKYASAGVLGFGALFAALL